MLEYFEASGDAVARLSYEPTTEPPPPPPPPPEPFAAEYFDNTTLAGDPVLRRSDDAIDFDWGDGAPAPGVPGEQFSARWTRTKTYAAGTYRFSVTGDDGIRVLIDGTPVIDGWFYQAPTTYSADVALPEGEHTVVVEYFEWTGGAVARFSETKLPDRRRSWRSRRVNRETPRLGWPGAVGCLPWAWFSHSFRHLLARARGALGATVRSPVLGAPRSG